MSQHEQERERLRSLGSCEVPGNGQDFLLQHIITSRWSCRRAVYLVWMLAELDFTPSHLLSC